MFVIGLLLLKLSAYFYVCGQLFYNLGHYAGPVYGKDLDRKLVLWFMILSFSWKDSCQILCMAFKKKYTLPLLKIGVLQAAKQMVTCWEAFIMFKDEVEVVDEDEEW